MPTLKDCTTPAKAREYVEAVAGLRGWNLSWPEGEGGYKFQLTTDGATPLCFSTRELSRDPGQRAALGRGLRERGVDPTLSLTRAADKDHQRRLARGKQVRDAVVPAQPHEIRPLPDYLYRLHPSDVVWSTHALERLTERGIGFYEVIAAIDGPDFTSAGNDDNPNTTCYHRGSVRVVASTDASNGSYAVVTVIDRNRSMEDEADTPTDRKPLAPTQSQLAAYGVADTWQPTIVKTEPAAGVVAVLKPAAPVPSAMFIAPPETVMPRAATPRVTEPAPTTLELVPARQQAIEAWLESIPDGHEFAPATMRAWLVANRPQVDPDSVSTFLAEDAPKLGLVVKVARGVYRKPYTAKGSNMSRTAVDTSLPWGVPPQSRRAATDYPLQWYLTSIKPGQRFSPDDMVTAIESRRDESAQGKGRRYGSPDMGQAARSGTIQRLRSYATQRFAVRYIEEGVFERLTMPGEPPAGTPSTVPTPAQLAATPAATFSAPTATAQAGVQARFERFIAGKPAGWKFTTEELMAATGINAVPLALWYLSRWSRGEGARLAPSTAANSWAVAAGPVTVTRATAPAPAAGTTPIVEVTVTDAATSSDATSIDTGVVVSELDWEPAPVVTVPEGDLEFVEIPPPPVQTLEDQVTTMLLDSGAANFVDRLRTRPGDWAGLPGTAFTADLQGLELRVVRPNKGAGHEKEYRIEARIADEHSKP